MLTSLSVRHFRGFRELDLKDLARVNLIVGGNNTGKTAVLEALQLLCAPGHLQQGMEQPDVIPLTRQTENHVGRADMTVGWWFHRQDVDKQIEISADVVTGNVNQGTRQLRIDLVDEPKGMKVNSQLRATQPWTLNYWLAGPSISGNETRAVRIESGRHPDFVLDGRIPVASLLPNANLRNLRRLAEWYSQADMEAATTRSSRS